MSKFFLFPFHFYVHILVTLLITVNVVAPARHCA